MKLLYIVATLSTVDAHVKMSVPSNGGRDNSPARQMCGGTRGKANPIRAGSSMHVVLEGTATHNGGGCQFGLSYDDAKTFTLLMTTEASCPIVQNFDVPIPANAPACEKCVFSWGWIPKLSGGPEYYMSCAEVKIESNVTGSSLEGPKMPLFNLPGFPTVHVDNKDKSATIGLTERFGVFVLAASAGSSTKTGVTVMSKASTSSILQAMTASAMSPKATTTQMTFSSPIPSTTATNPSVTYIDQRTLVLPTGTTVKPTYIDQQTLAPPTSTTVNPTYIDQRTLVPTSTTVNPTYIDQRTLAFSAASVTHTPSRTSSVVSQSAPSMITPFLNSGNTPIQHHFFPLNHRKQNAISKTVTKAS
jgi:hypothetical protein